MNVVLEVFRGGRPPCLWWRKATHGLEQQLTMCRFAPPQARRPAPTKHFAVVLLLGAGPAVTSSQRGLRPLDGKLNADERQTALDWWREHGAGK